MVKEEKRTDPLSLLMEVMEDGKYLNIALKECLDERHFLSFLIRGVVENAVFLDYVIDSYSKTPVRKMKPVIRNIMRMASFEILFADSVPDHAAVNEAVKLAKKRGFLGLSGFVNGVLRNIARNKEDILKQDYEPCIRYSMPKHIYDMWEEEYGKEKADEICRAFLEPSDVTLRVNTLKTSPEELADKLDAERDERLPYVLRLKSADGLTSLPGFKEGLFYIQDITSMMVCEKAGIKKDMKILDMCSAPGGKSINAALLMEGTGEVTSRDVSEKKVGLIKENVKRLDLNNIKTEVKDALKFYEEDMENYDIVIADLPCSGLGIIGKKPDIKYRVTKEDIESLQKLQRDMLKNAVQYVKNGGRLVYSTCTVTSMENSENTGWIEHEYPMMKKIYEEQFLPEAGSNDGFFISVFERQK